MVKIDKKNRFDKFKYKRMFKKKNIIKKTFNNYLKLLNKIIYGEFDPGSG